MANPQSSVLVDPLADVSLVSLFPRTFNQHDFDPDPNPRYNDPLEAFGAHLESMALKNHNRLLEQAKSILDGGLESLNIDNLENVGSQDSVGDVPGVNNGNLQGDTKNLKHARDENTVDDLRGGNQENLKGRRPGMGRKKARFSMKPNPSQPMEFEPYVDMDKLSDPVEFFAALEKQENAKNEWRRQSGKALMDLDQNVPLRGERRRRPGLLGKSATYRHRYSMAPSVDDKTFLSYQETLSQDLCSPTPSDHRLQPEHSAQIPLSPTKEWAGRANAGKEKSNDIRDELPLGEDKDDESDEIIRMLHQRFMPMEIGKSCLPELDSVLRSELLSIGDYLLGPQDNMSDLHDIVSAIGKETTLRCDNVKRSSGHTSTSPRPPKSPYSSISLLKARLFHSRKEKDSFSALDIDVSPLAKATSGQDAQDLAAKPSEKSVKDSVKMQNTSSVGAVNIESGSTTNGVDDTSETNLNSPVHKSECNVVTKDIQDLAALKFTSSESNKNNSMVPGDSSDFIEHTMLDDGPVEHGEMDIDPKSSLHEKGSDATNTMETAKDISKTLGVNSDGVRQDVLDHAFRRDQSPKPAESNVVHTEDVCGFDAPCQKTMRDNSIVSGIALNTSPHVELDHDVMANKKRDGVLEDNPSDVFDDAGISANELIEPDVRVVDKDVQGCNMEKSNYNKEQSTVNAIENLEKHGSSSDRYKLFTAGAGGDLDHDRPSSSSARPLKKTLKASSKMAEKKKSKARGAAHEHPPAEMSAAECTRSKAREAAHEYPPAKTRAAATRKPTRESIFCTRNILAGCGTQWETGVRRSTRIRSRPLEYWKGERQLFGRIHDGLITVVGTKYFSPEKEAGKVVLKVKSYVSDEYKEMVEWAAL